MAHPKSILAILALLFFIEIRAADPELLEDFAVPDGVDENKIDGGFFTYTGLRGGAPSSNGAVGQKIISVHEFPALNGMGLSLELLEFPPGSVNAPHTHPRGAEILFVMDGVLTVGVSDGNGKLYKNVLQKGDVSTVPKCIPSTEFELWIITYRIVPLERKLVKGKILVCDHAVKGDIPMLMNNFFPDVAFSFPLPTAQISEEDNHKVKQYLMTTK
ncbi:germin-like protein 9-3 [Magnolia sinica]|uniref:germin-like protein 9-3 n=1 Tax=Magnolia sinica TaxID=86752 RepID=UPI00265B3258|nr:germin-like protein 9-3 [Magnolia sinica]